MKTRPRAGWRLAPAFVIVIGLTLGVACSKDKKAPPAPTVPVMTATTRVQPVPLALSAVGSVEPIESVSVRPQVGGVITKVAFDEGQDVKSGQLLFQIDPRPLQAALDAARAQLSRDQAQSANAKTQAERYERLVARDYVTKEQYDAVRTQAEAMGSAVQGDQAAVDQARLNLAYASVTSPIAGRTGAVLVKKGNVVTANGTPLLVVNQIRPIRVSFTVPGSQLALVQKYTAQGNLAVRIRPSGADQADEAGQGGQPGPSGQPGTQPGQQAQPGQPDQSDQPGQQAQPAQAGVPDQADRSVEQGRLVFVDNTVDPSTGTVALKAEFANDDGSLWPGQFVTVELVLTVQADALTVPAPAVVTGQQGPYVYVVGPDNKVQQRPVTVARTVGGVTVVSGGLTAGDVVVTDGQLRLVPGATVQVRTGQPGQAQLGEGQPGQGQPGQAPAGQAQPSQGTPPQAPRGGTR